ncbi:MAG: hypothetical protein QMD92_02120 [bacterium]|nr:hypothetical protein [bacterium]
MAYISTEIVNRANKHFMDKYVKIVNKNMETCRQLNRTIEQHESQYAEMIISMLGMDTLSKISGVTKDIEGTYKEISQLVAIFAALYHMGYRLILTEIKDYEEKEDVTDIRNK